MQSGEEVTERQSHCSLHLLEEGKQREVLGSEPGNRCQNENSTTLPEEGQAGQQEAFLSCEGGQTMGRNSY